MKRTLCLLLALIVTLSLTACGDDGSAIKNHPENAQRGNQIGDLCYNTQLVEIDQNGFVDHNFDPTTLGKITVINFWAYWCPPCVQELPHFEQVAQQMADEVAVVAIHCDSMEKARDYIGQNYPDSSITFAMDTSGDAYAYYAALGGTGSIPYTVVLDASGIIRQTHVGVMSYSALLAAIDACR